MKFEHPKVTLSNGLCVVNFSSPHDFAFEDGNVLAACDPSITRALSLQRTEDIDIRICNGVEVEWVQIQFLITSDIMTALNYLQGDDSIDVVIIPFPVLDAIRNIGQLYLYDKCGTIYTVDRVSKTISTTRFCR